MPELPEVETVKNALLKLIINTKINEVLIKYPNITNNCSFSCLKNQQFIDILRIGKHLIFVLNDYYLLVHLRMEGKFYLKGQDDFLKHEHVIFYLDNSKTLRYHDTRKFGRMFVYPKMPLEELKTKAPLNKIGLEPFEMKIDSLFKLLNKNKPIKQLLLDQQIMAGLGNIYADEVLFMSRINPLTKGNCLNKTQVQNIITNSIIVLNKAISLGGTTIRSYTSSLEVSGRFQNELLVHTKKHCPICNNEITKIYINKRGTYYCIECQK